MVGFGTGAFEFLLMIALSSGGGILGLPPAERDANLVNCPPEQVVFYAEWAPRGEGKAGAPGIDGLAADPEIVHFVGRVKNAILASIAAETQGTGIGEEMGRNIPALMLTMLSSGGCIYGEVDVEKAMELMENPIDLPPFTPPVFGMLPATRFTIVVSAGEEADDFAKRLLVFLKYLPGGAGDEKIQMQRLPIPMEGVSLTLHREGKYFILGWGENSVETAVAGLQGKSQGLAKSARFTAAMKQVEIDRPSGLSWVDIQGTLAELREKGGEQGAMATNIANLLGLGGVEHYAACTGVVDGTVKTKQLLKTDGKTEGVLALIAGDKLTAENFNHIPADADMAFGLSVKWSKVLAAARQIVAAADPQSAEVLEETIKQLEEELVLSFDDDLFPAFGDAWTLYNSPGSGGVIFTAPVLAVEVRDAAKAKKVYDRLMEILQMAVPGEIRAGRWGRGVYLSKGEFQDHTVHFINTVGDDDMPLAPAFCLTKTHLLVALHPQPLKAHIRFAASDQPRLGKAIETYLSQRGAVEPICLSYIDAEFLTRSLAGLSPLMAQIIGSQIQRDGTPLNVFDWPSARALLPYVRNGYSHISRTSNGLESETHHAFPVPAVSRSIATLPVIAGFSFYQMRQIERILEEGEVEAIEAIEVID